MNGRDKRRRVKARKNEVPLDRLRRCKVMAALVEESTCNAKQRFQKSQEKNGCGECQFVAPLT